MDQSRIIDKTHKVWLHYYNPLIAVRRKIELMLRLSAHQDAILDRNRDTFVLSDVDGDDLIASGFLYLSVFWDVRCHFQDEDYPLFVLTAKAHYQMHSCLLSKSLNPRRSWCYLGEDFMGKCRHLATSCSRGASMWSVSNKIMVKYLIAMHMTLSDPDAWFRRR